MSRYTRTDTPSLRKGPGVGIFIGWDTLDGVSEEATYAEDLGLPVSPTDAGIFRDLASGEVREVGGFTYFRAF